MKKSEDILDISPADSTRPYVQAVKTTEKDYIFKFTQNAGASVYNQKVMLDMGMLVVDMYVADEETREDLNKKGLFQQFNQYDLLIMPKLTAPTFRELGQSNTKDKKKLFKSFADQNLVSAIATNAFDINSENVFAPNVIIDTQRALFKEKDFVFPVDKMFNLLTKTQTTFPQFYGYDDKKTMQESTKKIDKKLENFEKRVTVEFHETYETIRQRNNEFKYFLKDYKSPCASGQKYKI